MFILCSAVFQACREPTETHGGEDTFQIKKDPPPRSRAAGPEPDPGPCPRTADPEPDAGTCLNPCTNHTCSAPSSLPVRPSEPVSPHPTVTAPAALPHPSPSPRLSLSLPPSLPPSLPLSLPSSLRLPNVCRSLHPTECGHTAQRNAHPPVVCFCGLSHRLGQRSTSCFLGDRGRRIVCCHGHHAKLSVQ